LTKSSLTAPQQRLLELLQKINFGRIERLKVANGQPVLDPFPRVIRDLKLGSADGEARPELGTFDFVLKREHVDLFENLARIQTGSVEVVEVRHGLPFRILLEHQV
jgi:hypothetical protein